MNIEVKRERSNSRTVTTVTGTLIEVFDAIQSEFINYDPRGYGTSVDTIHMEGFAGDKFTARMSRMNSCD